MKIILQAIKSMFRGVYNAIEASKTHWDTRKTLSAEYAFDGDLEGKEIIAPNDDFRFVKVADDFPEIFSITDVIKVTYSSISGEWEDETEIIPPEEGISELADGLYFIGGMNAIYASKDGELEGIYFTKGLYFFYATTDDFYVSKLSVVYNVGELKKLDKKYLPDSVIYSIESAIKIEEASVGQTIVVKEVDANGKPTEWEAVDLPSGGGGNISVDTTLTQSGKAADAKAVGDALAEQGKTIPKVFKWANSELPFTKNEISGVASGGGFVVNPTNFADGKTYFRYNAGATYGFRWTNPNPQKGSLTITMRGYSQYSTTMTTGVFVVYMDGTESRILLTHGETVTYTTDPDKTVDYIRGNYDFENWVLLDMDALSIVADYPAPAGTVKSVNGILPDENGNVQVPTLDGTLVEPAEDDIPKVFFGGALQQTKDEAVVPFRYISKTQDVSGYAEIKAQGNSSMSYPKKNQTVKLYKDEACTEKLKVDFKGWGKQNKFCFKANWIDLSHARNVVSARLWADVVKSRANYTELPELLRTTPNQGAMDGFPIKVYADGVYQGRYTLNIPKDKWAFNMDDELDNHCVLCGENYASGCFRAAANINESDWTDEIHDTVPASIKTRWNEVISFVMNSTDADFKANLGNYFDVDSLIDYHLFGLATCGFDAYGKNQLYLTYDGQKWIASMYDMDSTWGLYWNGSKFVATDYPRTSYEDFVSTQSSGEGNLLYIRLEALFYEELQARWTELRNDVMTIDNVINLFERFTDITPAELVKEDFASTTGGGKFTGIPSQSTNNIQQIRAYALARLTWTDEYVESLTPIEEVPCTGIALSASTLTFTGAGSQKLVATVEPENTTDNVAWSVDDSRIASVTDGVVTARANGSCTITARCGEYSATCAVNVSGIEVEEQVDVLYENYSPAGASFSKTAVMDWENGYIEASIDLANCTGTSECILTVGTNVATWNPYNIHTNYTAATNTFEVSFVFESLIVARYHTALESTEILLRIDKNGLSINGTLLTEDDYNVTNSTEAHGKLLDLLVRNNRIEVGSAEGNTRSNATYHYIKVVGFGNGNVIYAPEWSDVAQFGLDNSSTSVLKTTGDSYYSGGYLVIPDNAISVSLSNINGATYTWKEMAVYDEHFTCMAKYYEAGKIGGINTSTAPTTINLTTLSGAKYIRATAYPNGIETNNDPNNQLEITFA